MKKKVLTIVAIVLVVALVAGGITAYCVLPHSLNYDIKSIESVGTEVEIVNKDVDSVTVKKDGEFKVLMFTDTHLDGKNETSYVTVENLVRNIQNEKPDLVIFGGDNVTSALNKKERSSLLRFLKSSAFTGQAFSGTTRVTTAFLFQEKKWLIFSHLTSIA